MPTTIELGFSQICAISNESHPISVNVSPGSTKSGRVLPNLADLLSMSVESGTMWAKCDSELASLWRFRPKLARLVMRKSCVDKNP